MKRNMKKITAFAVLSVILLSGCTAKPSPQTVRFTGVFGGEGSFTATTNDAGLFVATARQVQTTLQRLSALLDGGDTGFELGADAVNRFAGQCAVRAAPEVLRYADTLIQWQQRSPEAAAELPQLAGAAAVDTGRGIIALKAGAALPGGAVARGWALDAAANDLLPMLQTAKTTPTPPAPTTAAAGASPAAATPTMNGALLRCGGGVRVVGQAPARQGWPVAVELGGSTRALWLKSGGACIRTSADDSGLRYRALIVTAADASSAALLCEALDHLSPERGRALLRSMGTADALWVLPDGSQVSYGRVRLTAD